MPNQFDKIIFITGYGNEFFREEYFKDAKEEAIENFHLSPENIITHHTDSNTGTEENIESLFQTINQATSRLNPSEKIILIGHSRGGLILLCTLLRHPEIISNPHLFKIVTVQSPLKGTPSADIAKFLINNYQFFLKLANKTYCFFYNCEAFRQISPNGAASMISETTRINLGNNIFKLNDRDKINLSKKLFYVTSSFFRADKTDYTKIETWLLKETNDGTVPYSSQFIRGIGRRLARIEEMGHTDFVIDSEYKSSIGKKSRKKFAETLFNFINDPNLEYENFND